MSPVNSRPQPYVRLLIGICFLCVIGNFYELRAQSPCPQNGNAAWPQNSTIRFYIDFNLPEISQEQIRRAMAKWNTANQTNGSGVTFVEEPNPGISTTSLTFEPGENPTTLADGTPGWAAAKARKDIGPDGKLRSAVITIDPTLKAGINTTPGATGLDTIFEKLGLHEVGHTMGLGHVPQGNEEGGASVMNTAFQVNDSWNNQALNITPCDQNKVSSQSFYPQSSPTPTPETPCFLLCPVIDGTRYKPNPECNDCIEDPDNTPILVDVLGDGLSLTNPTNGVSFDLDTDGVPEQLSWISVSSDDAWLALDRNGNGLIDNGSELFGNFTPQPNPPLGEERNGFLALAEYDKPSHDGNSDGIITDLDAIFTSLRLWRDINHNGVSEASELLSLQTVGLKTLELSYKTSKYVDQHGNQFRYRAKVKDTNGAQAGRWAWDVFLISTR